MPQDDVLDPTAAVVDNGQPPVDASNEPGVTVDLTAKPGAKEPGKQPAVSMEDLSTQLQSIQQQNEQLRNQIRASYRVTERMQREMDELRRGVPRPTAQPTPTQTLADPDAQRVEELKPWEKPLRSWAKEEAERLFQEKEAQRQVEQTEKNRVTELERSQQFVLEKYPDLSSSESELTESYLSIVNSHPEWHKDPFGPVRAMLEMERIAREEGIQLATTKQTPAKSNTEVVRRARASASSMPPGRPLPSTNRVTLTKEQEQFAAKNRIPVETYAKMVAGLSNNGGVEIS